MIPKSMKTRSKKSKMTIKPKKVHVRYYALLREERGRSQETIETRAQTPLELYRDLQTKYNFKLKTNLLRVAINDGFCSWDSRLKDGDNIIFIPPVAGG